MNMLNMKRGTYLDNINPHLLDAIDILNTRMYLKDSGLCFTWLGAGHRELLGVPRMEDAIGKTDRDFFPSDGASVIDRIETNVLSTGSPCREVVRGILCPDGSTRSFIMNIAPVSDQGVLAGVIGSWTDISTMVRWFDKLGDQEAFFENLFRNATAIACVTDKYGNIIILNNRAADLFFGKDAGEMSATGTNILELIHDDDRAKAMELWNESITEKKEVSYQIRMKAGDGRIMYLLITGRPFFKDGEIVSFQYQALDMIDQKVQEQNLLQTSSMETVGQLAGGFAHDFNNLLTVINGYSEIMLNSIDRAHPFYSKIYQICQAGSQASLLTQKILEFSRKTRPSLKPVDINQELSNQESILKHLIKGNVNISMVKKEGLSKVMIDPTQFSKMLLNLVINAKDAMPRGGNITITTDEENVNDSSALKYGSLAPGNYLVVSVCDTGTGMSDDVKARIFDPFFTTRESGKGIGLWTVSSIVKQAGGSVSVESSPGLGTTFRILLPFCGAEECAYTPEPVREAPEPSSPDGKTILVVEDDDTVRELVSEILKVKGHHILTARNGGDALQLARQYEGGIDLLITDMVMRRIDGIMLSKKMLSIIPSIKVMLMSGYGNDVVKEEELKDISFLQKPFLPGELVDKVGMIFSGGK
jgi:two-component system, cell cycle sensor histidine kinase and response regulator CckA